MGSDKFPILDYWLRLEADFSYEKPFAVALMRSLFFIPLREKNDLASFLLMSNDDNEKALPIFTSQENASDFWRSEEIFSVSFYGKDFFAGFPLPEDIHLLIDPNHHPSVVLPPQALDRLRALAEEIRFLDSRGVKIWSEMNNCPDDLGMIDALSKLDLPSGAVCYYFEMIMRSIETGFVENKTDTLILDVFEDRDQTQKLIETLSPILNQLVERDVSIWNLSGGENAHFKESIRGKQKPIWPRLS